MSFVPFLVDLVLAVFLVWLMSRPIRSRGVRVIHTRGLPEGYVPPSASLRPHPNHSRGYPSGSTPANEIVAPPEALRPHPEARED